MKILVKTLIVSLLLFFVCMTASSQAMDLNSVIHQEDLSFCSVSSFFHIFTELNRSIVILLTAFIVVTFIANWKQVVDFVSFFTSVFSKNKWQSFQDLMYYLFICIPFAWIFRFLNKNRPKPDKAPIKYEWFFKWYEGVDATHCTTKKEWEKLAKQNRKSELFRRAYNIRFLGPGKGGLDSWGLWLFHCNGIILCIRYLFLLLLITGLFTCVYSVFLNSSEHSDNAIRSAVLSLWGNAEDKQISFFLLMIHWFVLTLISAIVLAIITKKVLDRRPNLVLPKRLIFDPNLSTFIIWVCNKDSVLLVDPECRLEFNVEFNDGIKSRKFRGQSIANSFDFLSSFGMSASSLDGMYGLIRKTTVVKPDEAVHLTVDQRVKPTSISIDSYLYGTDGTPLFPLFGETPNIKKSVRLFVYVTDSDSGQKYIYTKLYSPDNIICGSNAGLQPLGTTSLPPDWRVRNMLNWGLALPFNSIGFQERVKNDERRRENDAARERLKVFENNGTDEEAEKAYNDFLNNHEYEEGQKQKAQAAADKASQQGEDPQTAYNEIWYPHDLKVINCDTCPYTNCPLRGRYPSENPS